MPTLQLKTNLRCVSCVESIRPLLDHDVQISMWAADVTSPDKLLTASGPNLTAHHLQELMAKKGYSGTVVSQGPPPTVQQVATVQVISPSQPLPVAPAPKPTNYFPLTLIAGYLLVVPTLVEVAGGSFDLMRWMNHSMAGFFLVFSFFKFLNISGFAMSFARYDLIAENVYIYGFIYPFLEFGLGCAYLLNTASTMLNITTAVLMFVGIIGAARSLRRGKRVECACLGTAFALPVGVATLVEYALMLGMSLAMLVMNR